MCLARLCVVVGLVTTPVLGRVPDFAHPFRAASVVVSDYNDVFLVDIDSANVRQLSPRFGTLDSFAQESAGYMPTGTYDLVDRI